MKKIALLTTIAATALLAACVTTPDQQEAAQQAYDKICTAEPPLYAAFVAAATAKGTSEAKLRKAEAIHGSITTFCTNRPTDVVSGLVTLSAAYVQFITINASVK